MQPREAYADPTAIVDIDETEPEGVRAMAMAPHDRSRSRCSPVSIWRGGHRVRRSVRGTGPDIPDSRRRNDPRARRCDASSAPSRLPDNDDVLAQAIRRSKVVVGQSGFRTIELDGDVRIVRFKTGLALIGEDPTSDPRLVSAPPAKCGPVLSGRLPVEGLFSIKQEPDGVVRRVPLSPRRTGSRYPP